MLPTPVGLLAAGRITDKALSSTLTTVRSGANGSATTDENLVALSAALTQLGARLRVEGEPEGFEHGYEELHPSALHVVGGALNVPVASLEDGDSLTFAVADGDPCTGRTPVLDQVTYKLQF